METVPGDPLQEQPWNVIDPKVGELDFGSTSAGGLAVDSVTPPNLRKWQIVRYRT